MSQWLETPIEFLKGVGPQRAELLRKELGIFTFEDLLQHFPFRYVDRTSYQKVKDLHLADGHVQLKGQIISIREVAMGARKKRLSAIFQDDTGTVELVWYQGIKFIQQGLKAFTEIQLFGKPSKYNSSWTIPHPEITPWSQVNHKLQWQAVYPTTEKLTKAGLHAKGIHKLQEQLISTMKAEFVPETLPKELVVKQHYPSKFQAYQSIHLPQLTETVQQARFRFKMEELLHLQIELLLRKAINLQKQGGIKVDEVGNVFHLFYENNLPFPLTNAQKRVLKEIRKDLGSGFQMNRLLQGDVGSGKTVVALLTMLMGIDSGLQSCLMAPTEILAQQHYAGLSELLQGTSVKIALLTGTTKKAQRKILHEQLLSGEIHILVGTHALIEDVVQFKSLGIVVIDEQHRFGVAQRAKLGRKSTVSPHILVMTATPIPRTLAMTFYGDLDVSVIDELPPGRKPITTTHRFDKDRLAVLGFLKKEIALGRQVYMVYPLIQESEKLDYANLMDGYEAMCRYFPLPEFKVSIVHGQMKPEAKDYEMQQFVKGETQIMVATTVIEVGVNVPNASVMVIESAERFGLSQLHQLRGRVGRGAEQSYCILMTSDKLSSDTKKRLTTMVRTNDGFEIAEVDLELRGPGDIMGTQQSGVLELKIADLTKDGPLVAQARDFARTILEKDPRLEQPEHAFLRREAVKRLKDKPNWAEIA